MIWTIKTPKKFSPEELKEVTNLQENFNKVTFRLGQLSINREALNSQETVLKEQLTQLKVKEQNLAKTLSDKYGKGTFDLETNEFKPVD